MKKRNPIVQVVLTEKYYNKLVKLAEKETRSNSNQGARIIEQYIDQYEKEHGEIKID